MAAFKAAKVVSVLPGTLTPNTIYLVRTGAGFDLYCSDSTGAVAHTLNPPPTGSVSDPKMGLIFNPGGSLL